ncbi:hypothetical protein [uncultured Clostridium sp.]|uniref:hypothetical protein n=1 Tax=uncultured Clostridium sp. TaxID=59620 RepID=UPI0032179F0B
MIDTFKSKEELEKEKNIQLDCEIEKMFENYPGIAAERALRIIKGDMEKDDRLCISNNFISVKRILIKYYKMLDHYRDEKRGAVKTLELDVTKECRLKYENYIQVLQESIDEIESAILNCGDALINGFIPLMDKYFTENEIIQLLSGAHSQAIRIREWIDKRETGTESLTTSYILHHVEYRWRKGRCKDFVDCPDWEMPFFNCLSSYMFSEIRKNPEIHQELLDFQEELFGDCMVNITKDDNGNIINVEKVIQELKATDLIKDYQGSFINKLKKTDVFSDEEIYKIKRVDIGVYNIIGEDKSSIATIYKKGVKF